MSIWGKLIGGGVGFAVGGPIGALLGALGGHLVDKVRRAQQLENATDKDPQDPRDAMGLKSATFTLGIIVLGAKMAKADGHVTRDEIDTFRRVFRIPPNEAAAVARLFDRARRDASGFEPYARQLARLFQDQPGILGEILWCLAEIARADGGVSPGEETYLRQVAQIFGFGDDAAFTRVTGLRGGGASADPYDTLGLSADADIAAIKAAYRQLALEHHPDRLMAQGLPEEFIETANRKLAEINAAYDTIKKQLGFS